YRRTFSNAQAVERVLREHGFEEVCGHQDPDTIAKCATAEFVFSLEGANFINALFCPAGTRVLLAFPDRLAHSLPFALSLVAACGFTAVVVSAETIGPSGIDIDAANVYLDPGKLEEALHVLGAG